VEQTSLLQLTKAIVQPIKTGLSHQHPIIMLVTFATVAHWPPDWGDCWVAAHWNHLLGQCHHGSHGKLLTCKCLCV